MNEGWRCPGCQACFSPIVTACPHCGPVATPPPPTPSEIFERIKALQTPPRPPAGCRECGMTGAHYCPGRNGMGHTAYLTNAIAGEGGKRGLQ